MRSSLVPRGLISEIEAEINVYPDGLLKRIVDDSLSADGKLPLAIKFISAKWARSYFGATAKLKISTTMGFTWGTGTYVTPTAFPISSAIFGRIGVVAQFDPAGWRVFDATRPQARLLYLSWLQFQPLYQVLALTLHSQLANQYLRDLFRATFHIDCVLFHPDQFNPDYTRLSDVWMNVTDWAPTGEILNSFSDRLMNPRAAIIVEEEFEPTPSDIGRKALIGPLSPKPSNIAVQKAIASAYQSGKLLRLTA